MSKELTELQMKILKQDINWMLNDKPTYNFKFFVHHLLEMGFDLYNQYGKFEGTEDFDKEELHWVVMTHPAVEITLKLTANEYFGCELEIINDPQSIYHLIEETEDIS